MTAEPVPVRPLAEACRDTLLGWRPPSPEQEQLRGRYLAHLSDNPDGWSRGCRGAHLTASSLICLPDARQVLLTLHARIGRWLQTGGHLEPADGSLAAAARREAVEESGLTRLTLDPTPLLLSRHEVVCGGWPTYHLDVQFLVVCDAVTPLVVSEESSDLRWFSQHELPEVDESVSALVTAAAARLGQA